MRVRMATGGLRGLVRPDNETRMEWREVGNSAWRVASGVARRGRSAVVSADAWQRLNARVPGEGERALPARRSASLREQAARICARRAAQAALGRMPPALRAGCETVRPGSPEHLSPRCYSRNFSAGGGIACTARSVFESRGGEVDRLRSSSNSILWKPFHGFSSAFGRRRASGSSIP